MQTHFTPEQLESPDIQLANDILRSCVHCGFCLATCPTYTLWGDELDSPRGRIYQIKDMLETGEAPTETLTTHMDRCLSCFACVTTCPSGVDYMHLSDLARERIEDTNARSLTDKILRRILAVVLPSPQLFRWSLMAAGMARPFKALLPKALKAGLSILPKASATKGQVSTPGVFPAQGEKRMRVALLAGCVQQVLGNDAHDATISLLTRHGVEVVVAVGAECCGSLDHHMGRTKKAEERARNNVAAWEHVAAEGGLDAVVINASGCGTVVKDYGFVLRGDKDALPGAQKIAGLAKDITEIAAMLDLKPSIETGQVVAYHSACSMQHAQGLNTQPMALLASVGFDVQPVPEGHLCCGSAGTYNLLQPDAANELKARKLTNIASLNPHIIATGNIGCQMQLADGADVPIVHTVELLDWATGGKKPF